MSLVSCALSELPSSLAPAIVLALPTGSSTKWYEFLNHLGAILTPHLQAAAQVISNSGHEDMIVRTRRYSGEHSIGTACASPFSMQLD